MTKLTTEDLNQIINIIKTNKENIFFTTENIDKKRLDLINTFKESPELLMKLLNETTKPYKSIKEIKKTIQLGGFIKPIKDTQLKFILENINF